jgi:hypothetical protein
MYIDLELIPMMIGITFMSAGLASATLAFAYSSWRVIIMPSMHNVFPKRAKRNGWLITIASIVLSPIAFGLFAQFIKTHS